MRGGRGLLPAPVRSVFARFQKIPYAAEATVLVLLLASLLRFPGGLTGSTSVAGAVGAAPLVLNAVGLVLVFRANRFLNLCQVQIGLFAGTLFDGLYRGQLFLHTAHRVCNSCVGSFPGATAREVNLVLAAVLAFLAAGVLSLLVYLLVFRRFANAPILVPTIVSVFLAQALNGFQGKISAELVSQDDVRTGRALQAGAAPVTSHVTMAGYPVPIPSLVLVLLVPVLLAGLAVYLRRSDTGAAIRAAADNPSRASTLGVDVPAVTSRIWIMIGLLSGLAALLPTLGGLGGGGSEKQTTIPISQLVVLLTMLVFAKFANLWMTAAAGLVLSLLSTGVQVAYSSQVPLEAVYVFLVGGLLLLQRDSKSRANREDFSGLDVTRELRPIPHELRGLSTVRKYVRLGSFVVAALLLGLPWAVSLSQTSLLVDALGLAVVGLSLLVLTGWGGQVSLGQFGFASIGAWAAACSHLPFPLAVVAGGLAGAFAAVVVGLPALKLKGLNLAISTIAFALSARALFIDDRYLGGYLPDSLSMPKILGVDFADERSAYYLTLAVVIIFSGAIVRLRATRTGRALIAIRANEATAQSFGINSLRARLTAFSISGFMAAVAGALLAYHLGRVAPQAFTPEKSLVVFLYTVLGGLGGLAGPLLGMTFYALVTFFFADNPLVQYVGAGLGAVLLMMAAPGGLAQLAYSARDAMLRRLAYRLRIPVPSLMGDKGAALSADRIVLDEKREAPRRPGDPVPLVFKPAGQWALDRLGRVDEKERVGVR
jgi:branched-chain amino acid transport system permease protein